MPPETDDALNRLAEMLTAAKHAVAFTGAGISTESGIDDFRSPGGIWSRQSPVMFHDFLKDPGERARFWQLRKQMLPAMLAARPNEGHLALASLEQTGRLRAVITQNIDELHQRAGSRRVLEIHGTAMKVHCLDCDKRWDAAIIQTRLEAGEQDFLCDSCGGLLKSMTISFGQPMPAAIMQDAAQLARQADLFIAIGSSLVVHPAAELPAAARRHGARLVIINRDETPLDHIANLVIREPIGATMRSLMQRVH